MQTKTEVITFRGVVQGVGFRPTVYRIAQRLGMKGSVRNMGGAVQIACTGTPAEIDRFVGEIVKHKPPMSRISGVERKAINPAVFHEFSIGPSGAEEDEIAIVPADIAVCEDCLREFFDPDNPRHKHPFISCTNCGPRYTIMERLPYDRDATTMDDFPMCGFCGGEYRDPLNRRYHAQTVSCHECGPMPLPDTDEAINALRAKKVIALKGVGGYYLACSPTCDKAVRTLREIKRREQKPFAVMFGSIEQVREYCVIGEAEEAALTSPERPIVLLEQRPNPTLPLAPSVNNTSRFVGAFLPSFGLQHLLIGAAGPLIMTSANLSDLPLITDDKDMEAMAAREPSIAYILYNKRRIAAGLDDSVVRVIDGAPQLIRRSKGYVPAPIYIQAAGGTVTQNEAIFAAGGHLKSAFALSKGAYAYMGPHLGDMDAVESEEVYLAAYERMKTFFGISPRMAVCDLHPRYFPTRFAGSLGLPLLHAQHHHAHVCSVMAEHGLAGPVIGVAFDGTGYGADGTVWGGEILICEGAGFERFSHLKTVEMLGGDASMKEAWKSAAAHLYAMENANAPAPCPSLRAQRGNPVGANGVRPPAPPEFTIDLSQIVAYCRAQGTLAPHEPALPAIAAALRTGTNTVKTSSMGRLFDAAAALLGIADENRYEGECAIMLENAAAKNQTEQENLAFAFHQNVANAILGQCRRAREAHKTAKVCLSGGVFQNKLLMEETLRLLRADGFAPYYNINVPPNDGGLALGQIYIGMMAQEK